MGKEVQDKVNKGEKITLDPEDFKMNDEMTKKFSKAMENIEENADEEKLKAFNEKIM